MTANVHPVFASQSDRAYALHTAVVVDFDSSVLSEEKRGHYVMFKVELRTCLYQFWIYEDNELQWEHQLERMLSVLHQDDHEILSDKKSS